jgi:replicative DNA helicase
MKLTARHDLESEQAVIGAVLLDAAECWPAASTVLHASDFHDNRNTEIWNALCKLSRAGSAIDLLVLRSELLAQDRLALVGDEYLTGLLETIPTLENTLVMAKRVRALSLLRQIQRVAWRLAGEASEPIADMDDFFERAATAIAQIVEQRNTGLCVVALADALVESYSAIAKRQTTGQTLLGYGSGFAELDAAIGGLVPGDLILVAARPGMGKTAFANEIKLAIARNTNKPVLSLELEMTKEQLAHRVLSVQSGIELRRIRAASLGIEELGDIANAADELGRLPISFIVQRDIRISELATEARRIARQQGQLGLLVVDYLQIARAERYDNNREREISQIGRSLKSLAGELHCPVLALSALNRSLESRSGSERRPRLSDLRESGALEQDADTVLFIYRDELYNPQTQDKGIAEIIVGKQRSGPTGTIKLRWVGELACFESLHARRYEPQQQPLEYASNGHGGSYG